MTRVESLSVISNGFLGSLIVISAILWLSLRAVHRRRGRIAVVSVAVCALLFSVSFAADAVNAHFQYLPRLSDVLGQSDWPTIKTASFDEAMYGQQRSPATSPSAAASPSPAAIGSHPHGAVVSIDVKDHGVGFHAGHALVYLPPQYFTDTTERFPVVYLFHGSPGMPVDWLRGGGAASAGLEAASSGRPQILVMPHLSRNWLDDSECVNSVHMAVESYVINDLVPAVDEQLRTVADRDSRTVAGMSAGGYCALNLGLRHRDIFGSIVDMSGYTHPTHSSGMAALFGHRADLSSVVASNSPDIYGPRLKPAPLTRLYFLCGSSDHGPLVQMTAMRNVLRARGFPVTWVTRPGGHTYGVWRPGLVAALNWTPQGATRSS